MPSEFPTDSSGNGFFPAVHPVSVGSKIVSTQQSQFAKAINARLLSGLGDMHWRSLWAMHSMVRKLRTNTGGTPFVYTAEDEWWRWYGLLAETDFSWPSASPGAAEGLNYASPIVQYFFGEPSVIGSEQERTSDYVPLREGSNPAPSTVLEIWDLGKDQRGSITSSDLTDFTYAYALDAARIQDNYNSTVHSLFPGHKTLGGRIDTTNVSKYEHEKGQQFNQLKTQFLSEWRGTAAERNDNPLWQPSALTVDYESMLESQYFLAPAYGTATGSEGATVAEYPLFEWSALAAADTYGVFNSSNNLSNQSSFSFAGFIAVGSNLSEDKEIDVEIDGAIVHSFRLTVSEPQESIWFPIPKKGNLKIKLKTALTTGSEDVWVEVAQLLDFKPDIVDLSLFVRLATTRSSSPTIYRGKIKSSAKEISDSYFNNGMILNTVHGELFEETYLAKNAPYQSWKDFVLKWFRIVGYRSLKGYYVNSSGNSVLVFDRRGEIGGVSTSSADYFQNIAPDVDGSGALQAIGNNSIRPDVLYAVKPSGPSPSGFVVYNSKKYFDGDTFRGTYLKGFNSASATDLSVYEEGFLVDPDSVHTTGQSNEWIMSIGGQTLYDLSSSGNYKEDAWGDIYGTFHDRCHTFSEVWVGGKHGENISKFASSTPIAPSIMTRAETPPGYRYEQGDVPYFKPPNQPATSANPLIDAADSDAGACVPSLDNSDAYDSSMASDCQGIIQHYKSCQVYKQPYLIKAVTIKTSPPHFVEVELNGRLTKSDSAPSSISDSAASRASYLSTDTGQRTDENTVVALLNWKVDSANNDSERIGDLSPTALDASSGGDWNPSNIDGGSLCRFFFQRLMPHVYNDNNSLIEQDKDRRAYADLPQYAEFLIRASVGGFLDEDTISQNLTYNPVSTYCDNQESFDLTMPRLIELVEGSTNHDKLPIRRSTDKRGFGPLPMVKMRADTWTELGQAINLLKSSRVGVPVYFETKTVVKWDVFPADVQSHGAYLFVPAWGYKLPTTVRPATPPEWTFETLPFQDSALAYSTIWTDASGTNVLSYWREIHWRVRVHPLILEAVPESLRFAAQDSSGLAIPVVIEKPDQINCVIDDLDLTPISNATHLVGSSNSPECILANSGILAPRRPPTGAIVTSASGGSSGGVGDAEPHSTATIGCDSLAETYIRVPVK